MHERVDTAWAFRRYQDVRDRLPDASFPESTETVNDLGALCDRFDVFIFDSFGVLNVGDAAIPGAARRLSALRAAGKQVFVLTNAASRPLSANPAKYAALGFDFDAAEIVSSRAVLAEAMAREPAAASGGGYWAVAAPQESVVDELPGPVAALGEDTLDDAQGFVLLSATGWTMDRQRMLARALADRPRPLLVGNPDLVSPREDGFVREPGSYAHDLADELGIVPRFFGKPYASAFDAVRRRLPAGSARGRVLMIGDTLHTDILGGACAGLATALVTVHGVMRGMDVEACIEQSGIRPDFVLPSI